MQGVRCLPFPPNPDRDFLTIQTNSNPVPTRQRGPCSLTIDAGEETPERRIERLIREHPVVIFARHGCCMSHVMKQLLAAVGSHPSVIEVEESEIGDIEGITGFSMPALFVGGSPIGGIEGLMGLHLSGHLVPRLRELGVIWCTAEMKAHPTISLQVFFSAVLILFLFCFSFSFSRGLGICEWKNPSQIRNLGWSNAWRTS